MIVGCLVSFFINSKRADCEALLISKTGWTLLLFLLIPSTLLVIYIDIICLGGLFDDHVFQAVFGSIVVAFLLSWAVVKIWRRLLVQPAISPTVYDKGKAVGKTGKSFWILLLIPSVLFAIVAYFFALWGLLRDDENRWFFSVVAIGVMASLWMFKVWKKFLANTPRRTPISNAIPMQTPSLILHNATPENKKDTLEMAFPSGGIIAAIIYLIAKIVGHFNPPYTYISIEKDLPPAPIPNLTFAADFGQLTISGALCIGFCLGIAIWSVRKICNDFKGP